MLLFHILLALSLTANAQELFNVGFWSKEVDTSFVVTDIAWEIKSIASGCSVFIHDVDVDMVLINMGGDLWLTVSATDGADDRPYPWFGLTLPVHHPQRDKRPFHLRPVRRRDRVQGELIGQGRFSHLLRGGSLPEFCNTYARTRDPFRGLLPPSHARPLSRFPMPSRARAILADAMASLIFH